MINAVFVALYGLTLYSTTLFHTSSHRQDTQGCLVVNTGNRKTVLTFLYIIITLQLLLFGVLVSQYRRLMNRGYGQAVLLALFNLFLLSIFGFFVNRIRSPVSLDNDTICLSITDPRFVGVFKVGLVASLVAQHSLMYYTLLR